MIVKDHELPDLVRLAREHELKIVYTNGCFDLLHPGHVVSLQAMRALGDLLIVGVNSSYSVRLLKGEDRPIIGEYDRMRCVDALECVDVVYKMPGDNPRQDLHDIRPDVLAKGGTTPEIVGESIVNAYGGLVVRVPEYSGWSTSEIAEKLTHL